MDTAQGLKGQWAGQGQVGSLGSLVSVVAQVLGMVSIVSISYLTAGLPTAFGGGQEGVYEGGGPVT